MAKGSVKITLSLQDEDGHLTDRDMDKAEVCYPFFASVFNMDDRPRGSQCPARMTNPQLAHLSWS